MADRSPRILYVIKQVELATRARLEEIARPHGITALQYTALTVLQQQSEPISSAALARLSFVTAQTMSDMVGALERRGLVRRDADPGNRRRLLITLTDAGVALLDDLDPRVDEIEADLLGGMSAADRSRFTQLLDRSRQNLA